MRTGSRITPAASASISVTPMAPDARGGSTRTSTWAAAALGAGANTRRPSASVASAFQSSTARPAASSRAGSPNDARCSASGRRPRGWPSAPLSAVSAAPAAPLRTSSAASASAPLDWGPRDGPQTPHLRTAPGNPWRSSILVSSAAPRWPPNPPPFGPPRRSRGSPLIHTDGDGDAGDDRVAHGYAQPALHRPHRHLAVRQFALDRRDVHRLRIRHADRDIDQHAAAARAHVGEERQAGVADRA